MEPWTLAGVGVGGGAVSKCFFLSLALEDDSSSSDWWEDSLREQKHGAQEEGYCGKRGRADILNRLHCLAQS